MAELKREKLNEYYKNFNEIYVNVNKEYQFKCILRTFDRMDAQEKLTHKKINKRML